MKRIINSSLLIALLSILYTTSYAEPIPEANKSAEAGEIIILHYSKSVQERCDFTKQIVPVVGHGTFPYDDDFICMQR